MGNVGAVGRRDIALKPALNDWSSDPGRITLLVIGILVLAIGVGLGVAGLMKALQMSRTVSIVLTSVGGGIGLGLIIASIYKRDLSNFYNGFPSATEHNNKEKSTVETMRVGITSTSGYGRLSASQLVKAGWQERSVGEFQITAQNVNVVCPLINQAIDNCTSISQIVSIRSRGEIFNGQGSITVHLMTPVKV